MIPIDVHKSTKLEIDSKSTLREEWGELLRQIGGNQLHNSFDWIDCWWQTYRGLFGPNLYLAISKPKTQPAELIAPFYLTRRNVSGLAVRSAVAVGNTWRRRGAFVSENQSILTLRDSADAAGSIALALLDSLDIDEVVFPYLESPESSIDYRAISAQFPLYARLTDQKIGYSANLKQGFQKYLNRVSYSSRRRLYTYRKRLPHGVTELIRSEGRVASDWINAANVLSERRWSSALLSPVDVEFLRRFADRATNVRLETSILTVSGNPIAAALDFARNEKQWNILLVADAATGMKISPGLLMLGYQLEYAASKNVSSYDFLVGPGQSTDYKTAISDTRYHSATLHILCNRALQIRYRIVDQLAGRKSTLTVPKV